MNQNKRIYLWDNLRFILISLVVIGHFSDQAVSSSIFKSIVIFIYAFHVPGFFFLSGMFHKNKDISFKVYSYIMIGFLYKIAAVIVRHCAGESPKLNFLSEVGIPWFMFALAAFILLACLLRDVNPKMVLILSTILACFAGYDESLGDYLVLSRIIVFFPFYQLGLMTDKERLRSFSRLTVCRVGGWIVLISWGLMCLFLLDRVYIFRSLFTGRNAFNDYFYHGGCLYRLLCYGISALLCLALICITPDRKIPAVSAFGQRTMQVFFWHGLIHYAVRALNISGMICRTPAGKVLYLLCMIVLPFLLSLKLFNFPTGLILRQRTNTGDSHSNPGNNP